MRKTVFLGLAAAGLLAAVTMKMDVAALERPDAATQAQAPAPAEVARLYRLHCQLCHGANGKAPIPEMAFFERSWKHGTSSAAMAKVITEGVAGTPMLPFKGKLKPEQIQALSKYVRAFDPKLPPEK